MEKISWLQAILLGLVQGLTEFLPVSSSGHLVLVGKLLKVNTETSALFDIMLHVGTLAAVIVVYWKDVLLLFRELFLIIRDGFRMITKKEKIRMYPDRKLFCMVFVACIPTGFLGIFIELFLEDLFLSSVMAVGAALLVTTLLLFLSSKLPEGHNQVEEASYQDALIIGLFQGIAVTPGVSRSGSTTVCGMMCGLEKTFAIKFSFLISLPAIAGAALLKITDVTAADLAANGGPYLIGTLVAAGSGYLCIRWLLNILKNNKLHYFGYYTLVIGLTAIISGIIL